MTSFLGHLLLKTLLGFALIGVLAVCNLAYNLLLHPLRSYPGPWYSRGSMVWYLYHTFKGDYHTAIHKLHLKYGAVVRVAPNELAYTDPQAFKDIYGHRVNTPEMMKAPSQNFSEDPRHPNIIDAPREQHSKIRRLLSNAFSDKAIREQEPILKSYMNLLMDRLHQVSSEPVNIVRWYNFTTFDVIGHLAFAESFDCLSSSDYHTWVGFIFSTVKVITWSRAFNRLFMGASSFLMRLMPKRIVRESRANFELSKEKLFRRRQKHLDYTDFLTVMISAEEKGLITIDDLLANAPILIVAGSETTATLLSGATYYLLQNPRVYNLLVQEIRAAFQAREDITMTRVNGLKYLAAVLDEALRVYPPAPSNKPRVTPPEGANIVGRFVPGNTMVGINHYSAFRHPLNFNRPDEFIPERVLQPEKPEWSKDRREVLQPFSFGPRNCIGRNLALVEMRLVMAHILFEFDLEMQQDSVGWLNQKVFTTWQKCPLMVRLRPVQQ